MKKYILIIAILLVTIFSLSPSEVDALDDNGVPYRTFAVNQEKLTRTQDAYIPVKTIGGFNVDGDVINLNNPKDIIYDNKTEKVYIANTGTKQIIVANEDFSGAYTIGDGHLEEPTGVFVSNSNEIYVADSTAEKVFVFSQEGALLREYGKPDTPLYDDVLFKPIKVAVDNLGTMYIIDSATTSGILRMTSDGEFLGFYGVNTIEPSVSYALRFMFSTTEQKQKMYLGQVPAYNLALGNDGLISTVTKGSEENGGGLRKLNLAGLNLLEDMTEGLIEDESFEDVFVGPIGNIYVISVSGYIYEYDREGNLLFVFGGKDSTGSIAGLFSTPSGITVTDDYKIYATDNKNNSIQVFVQTDFASSVHDAIELFQDGKYEEAKEPWIEVLRLNQTFDLAHAGLANAYLLEGDYANALAHFQLGNDKLGYSDAYLELRNIWLLKNFSVMFVVFSIISVILLAYKKIPVFASSRAALSEQAKKVKGNKYVEEFSYIFKFITKPFDSFYNVKYQNKVSISTGLCVYVIFLIVILCNQLYSGFYFQTQEVELVSVFKTASIYVLPMILFAGCNYLVGSINDGEGKFKDIIISTIFSFSPIIVFMPILTIISNVLTDNESFVIYFGLAIIWTWSFFLLYFMVKDIHNFEALETVKNILITIVTMILSVAVAYLIYVLSLQIVDFIQSVIREVLARVI